MTGLVAIMALLAVVTQVATQPLPPPPTDGAPARKEEFDALNAAAKRNLVNHTGFVFDFFTGTRQMASRNAFLIPANVDTDAFTAVLEGFGNALNLLNFGPCSGAVPHTHPRAAEISFIVRGTIQFGYVDENSGQNRLVVVDALAGQVVFIPQGLLHFSHNLQCTPAAFLANFANRDPGVQSIWPSLLQIPTQMLAAAMNLADTQEETEELINRFKARMQVSLPATGGAECLRRCDVNYKEANAFMPSPLQRLQDPATKPLVPTDQLGNPQSYLAGDVEARPPPRRCDFLGLTEIPAEPGPDMCAKMEDRPDEEYPKEDHPEEGTRRRLQAYAKRVLAKLPKDKITVMNAADLMARA